MILGNSFSLNMLAVIPASIRVAEVGIERARALLEGNLESAVGHANTAAVFSNLLGIPVETRRATIALKSGDRMIVGQYSGPRLEEGATELPTGATIKWLEISIGD